MTYNLNGKTYTLQQYPHLSGDKYRALATDEAGLKVYLIWDIRPDYNREWEFDACDWNHPSGAEEV